MSERQALVDQLIWHEGVRLKVYTDTLGVPSIGCGRNLRDKGLSEAEAMLLLDHDIDEVILDLATFAWFPPLDSIRQRAVIDLRFNLGHDGFRFFAHFIAAMAQKNYLAASQELQNSRWSRQVQPDRVKRLRSMIETGEQP